MELFLCYKWPGNIRELRNVIHYAVNVLNRDEGRIELRHLPEGKFHCQSLDGNSSMNLKDKEKCFRESMIRHTMAVHEGDYQKVMQTLGVSKNTVYRAMSGGHHPHLSLCLAATAAPRQHRQRSTIQR